MQTHTLSAVLFLYECDIPCLSEIPYQNGLFPICNVFSENHTLNKLPEQVTVANL